MSSLKLAFIGGGVDSAVGYTHLIASQLDRRWQVTAGAFSRDRSANERSAKQFQVDNYYNDWRELISCEQDKIDAIAVLTPTPTHKDIVLALLNEDIPVICEKALVSNSNDAHEICKLIKNKESFFAVTYNYTGYPMIRELRQQISLGKFGKIHKIEIEMPQEGFSRLTKSGTKPQPQEWRLHDGNNIPTISLDLGVHLHHMVYFLTNEEPLDVVATEASNGLFENIIDDVSAISNYTNKLKVQFWYSKSALGYRNGLKVRVFGDRASAEWYQLNPEELLVNKQTGERVILDRAGDTEIAQNLIYNRFKAGHPAGFVEAFANLYRDIADGLIEYKNGIRNSARELEMLNPDIAHNGLIMLEAMHKSAQNRKWQAITNHE